MKVPFQGTLTSIQPRIRLTRSFDERAHSYLGDVLVIAGTIGDEPRPFSIAIGQAAHSKHQFSTGDHISGEGHPVANDNTDKPGKRSVTGVVKLKF